MSDSLTLVADIGGTHARFALADTRRAEPLLLDSVRQLTCADYPTLVDAARHYETSVGASAASVGDGVFAVAGRVDGDVARITNHPWLISRRDTAAELGMARLQLVNDFTAQAMATTLLAPADVALIGDVPLPTGPAEHRTFAIVGPGTGLGVSGLLVRDGRTLPLETEGGHVGFSPSSAEEAKIQQLLAAEFGRVSNERLLSGGGLCNIHRALLRLDGRAPTTALQPADITAGARAGDPDCRRAVEIFCEVFGTIAGDLVLMFGAWDGVFLTGGLVPKMLADLQAPHFRRRFEAKGRFTEPLSRVPVAAVLHPQAGLLGAAALAIQGARGAVA